MSRIRLLLPMLVIPVASALGGDLGGSRASMRHQNEVAHVHDFTFLRTAAEVRDFVEKERLVEVLPNLDLLVHNVSFPYTRPIIKTFIERLAAQFRRATGEQLVVTSLTRPTSSQPRNASPLSVHPAGMAVDLRIPKTPAQRAWLEGTLLSLEKKGLLDVTRERNPPHYHVAVFPESYEAYVAPLIAHEAAQAKAAAAMAAAAALASAQAVIAPAAAPVAAAPREPVPPAIPFAIVAALTVIAIGAVRVGHRAPEARADLP